MGKSILYNNSDDIDIKILRKKKDVKFIERLKTSSSGNNNCKKLLTEIENAC